MSHISQFKTVRGKPLITDLEAVRRAAANLGLLVHERPNYRWYGRHMGDYPVPAGWNQSDMGRNATLVLGPDPEKAREMGVDPDRCYELGVVEDKLNPGAYTLMYDFFAGGCGLDKFIGSPVFAKGSSTNVEAIAPTFMQHYRMCADALAAREVGDAIEFEQNADGSWTSWTVPNEERLRAEAGA